MHALIAAVATGEAPYFFQDVRIDTLAIRNPRHLQRVRHLIDENPSMVSDIYADWFKDPTYRWSVYRADDGTLVMFDDYAAYAAAEKLGVKTITVQVFGEEAPLGLEPR